MSQAVIRFAVLLGAGFLGAAATGKLVPHARWLSETYDISLGMSGFVISAVMLPGAVLSAGLGVVTDRLGARNVAVTGMVLAGLASALLGTSAGFATLIGLRLAEGIGYCLLVVGATVLVVEVAAPRQRTLALAVWSSFAPVGFALGQWAAASVDGAGRLATIGRWHGVMLLAAAALALVILPRRNVVRAATGGSAQFLDGFKHPPALLAALAFGCVTGVLLAAVAVTPLVLARMNDMSVGEAAKLTALAALPGIAGRFAAGWLLDWRMTPRDTLLAAGATGSIAIGLVLLAGLPLLPALVLFTLFQILMGVIPGVLSAMIPQVAPAPDRIGTVSGLVNQMVTLGNLLGPPLVLGAYAMADAAGATGVLVAWTALCVGLVVHLAVFRRPVA